MRILIIIAGALAALALLAFVLRTPDTDPAEMEAKYANAASRFAEGDGLRVHYRDQGNPEGVPIILLHGTSATLHTWEPLVALLGEEYRVITYSQPGHGLTGPHPRDDYSAAGMAEALDLVTEELGLESFVLGGNSMGGWVAWRYALANPKRVSALILLDASGMPLREGEAPEELNIGFRLVQSPVGRFLVKHYTPRWLIRQSGLESVSVKTILTEEAVDRYWELIRYPGNRRAAALGWIREREPDMANRIGEIDAPTLIIWGAEDQLIYPSAAQTFDERMSNADVVIYEGVGHLPMEEAPERTALDIDTFLERTIKRDDIGANEPPPPTE